MLWAKGYTELLERLEEHAEQTGARVDVDVFGTGPDMHAVQEEAGKRQLPLRFNGAMDHADKRLQVRGAVAASACCGVVLWYPRSVVVL